MATAPGGEAGNGGTRVVLEVVEGPLDGARLSGRFHQVTIGRDLENDLGLWADATVSGRHARLAATRDPTVWRLADRDSTNGTFAAGQRVTATQELAAGHELMVGSTVLRFSRSPGVESFLPDAERLASEAARIFRRAAPASASGYGAAVAMALEDKRSYVTGRDLTLGLMIMTADSFGLTAVDGALSLRLLADVLRRNDVWRDDRAWIQELIDQLRYPSEGYLAAEVMPTPRLAGFLLAAEEDAGGGSVEPVHLLRAILGSTSSRACRLFDRAAIDPGQLLAAIERAPGRPPLEVAPPPEAEVSSGDPTVDLRAQEAARLLAGKAAAFQLAEPAERRSALRELLLEEVARLAPERRRLLLEQLARLFPVSAAEQAAELTRLEAELAELRSRSAEPRAAPASPGGGQPLDASRRELVHFAQRIERLIVGMVGNLTGESGASTGLPGSRLSIEQVLGLLEAGRETPLEGLCRHLKALELWLMAALGAYHEAPEAWFRQHWRRVAPARIEKRLSEAGWKKKLGIQSLDLWDAYLEEVRDVTPELAEDEILRLVRQRAQHNYQRLTRETAGGRGGNRDV